MIQIKMEIMRVTILIQKMWCMLKRKHDPVKEKIVEDYFCKWRQLHARNEAGVHSCKCN